MLRALICGVPAIAAGLFGGWIYFAATSVEAEPTTGTGFGLVELGNSRGAGRRHECGGERQSGRRAGTRISNPRQLLLPGLLPTRFRRR